MPTMTDTLRRDSELASETQAYLSIEDDIAAILKEGGEVPAELSNSYQEARDAMLATSEDVIRRAETAEALN